MEVGQNVVGCKTDIGEEQSWDNLVRYLFHTINNATMYTEHNLKSKHTPLRMYHYVMDVGAGMVQVGVGE